MLTDPLAPNAVASDSTLERKIGLADNFDSFLKLLTTQLTSQDPLSPLDANQFTEQLVQFTGVEQAIKTNSTLDQLVAMMRGAQAARGLDYLGAEVEAGGDTVRLGADGPAQFDYHLERDAASVVVQIRDQAGTIVHTQTGEGAAGPHALTWNGLDAQGRRQPEGLYRFEIEATSATGEPVAAQSTIRGVVDGIEIRDQRLLLSVAGALIDLERVTSIRRPATAAP